MLRRLRRCAPDLIATRVSAASCSVEQRTKSIENRSIMRIAWNDDSAKQSERPAASVMQAVVNPNADESPGMHSAKVQLMPMNLAARCPMLAALWLTSFGVPVAPEVRLKRHACSDLKLAGS